MVKIQAENVSKYFIRNTIGQKGKSVREEFAAVDRISLQAREGEIVGILGPNGAGKTTLLRILGSLMQPSEGTVTIFDQNGNGISDPVEIRQNIGYLSGNTKLYHRISTREMLVMLGKIYGMSDSQTKSRIDEISKVLDLYEFIDNRIEKLSTGQTQRASIARCLIHDPSLYIFDEPTLGLDVLSADSIVSFMKRQKEAGKTVLYSTHYLEEAQFLCDRIIILSHGKIVKNDTPANLMKEFQKDNLRDVFHEIMEAEN